jgi:hypothetical protein
MGSDRHVRIGGDQRDDAGNANTGGENENDLAEPHFEIKPPSPSRAQS